VKLCFLTGLFAVPSLSCFLVIAPVLNGQVQDRRPVLRTMPPDSNNGQQWRELFHPPNQWVRSREGISVLGYADHSLNTEFKDDELRADFAQMTPYRTDYGD
jgi:hypothetical protein